MKFEDVANRKEVCMEFEMLLISNFDLHRAGVLLFTS